MLVLGASLDAGFTLVAGLPLHYVTGVVRRTPEEFRAPTTTTTGSDCLGMADREYPEYDQKGCCCQR